MSTEWMGEAGDGEPPASAGADRVGNTIGGIAVADSGGGAGALASRLGVVGALGLEAVAMGSMGDAGGAGTPG